MKQKTILLTATLLILAACSQSEIETEERAPKEIKATSVIEGATTRAVIDGTAEVTGLTFLRVDTKNGTPTDFSSATKIESCSRATDGTITFGTTQNYKTTGENAYFRGFTTEDIKTGNTTNGTTVWTPKGKTDILLTEVWDAGTYDNSKPGTSSPGDHMVFKHILSRIEVICQAEATSTSTLEVVKAAWGQITKIEIFAYPDITYTHNGGTVAASGTPIQAFELFAGYGDDDGKFTNQDIVANGTTTTKAVAMIPPISATTNGDEKYSFKLKVTTAGAAVTSGSQTPIEKEITVDLNDGSNHNQSMGAGKIHTVTLSFKADGKGIAIAASTIQEWTAGNAGAQDVVKPKEEEK